MSKVPFIGFISPKEDPIKDNGRKLLKVVVFLDPETKEIVSSYVEEANGGTNECTTD